MESNFAYNHLMNISKLKEILLQPYVDKCKQEFQFMDMETEDSLDTFYFIDDDKVPCCKISISDKGIIFYEKKI